MCIVVSFSIRCSCSFCCSYDGVIAILPISILLLFYGTCILTIRYHVPVLELHSVHFMPCRCYCLLPVMVITFSALVPGILFIALHLGNSLLICHFRCPTTVVVDVLFGAICSTTLFWNYRCSVVTVCSDAFLLLILCSVVTCSFICCSVVLCYIVDVHYIYLLFSCCYFISFDG